MDIKAYEPQFVEQVSKLNASERITREVLMNLSRTVIQAVQITEDSGYLNRVIGVLTPVNKKVAIAFFRAMSGFVFSDETGLFTKKDKKNYEAKKQAAIDFLADPHNNLWTWAERNIEVEVKPFELAKVRDAFASLTKKAEKAGFSQKDVVKEILSSGVTLETLMELMEECYQVEVNQK